MLYFHLFNTNQIIMNQKKPEDQKVSISRRVLGGDTPIVINEITDRCLFSSFYGTLDSVRIKKVIDALLEVVNRNENDLIIVDLSNVDIIDSSIAAHLKSLNKLLQLIGMDVIFCGIKPVVANSMVSAGVELENINVQKNLKRALKYVYSIQGLSLVKA